MWLAHQLIHSLHFNWNLDFCSYRVASFTGTSNSAIGESRSVDAIRGLLETTGNLGKIKSL